MSDWADATRDYLDFVALSHHMGDDAVVAAVSSLDRLYPQDNGESPLQQLRVQLANPLPFDLDDVSPSLREYSDLDPQWQDWSRVKAECARTPGPNWPAGNS